MPGFSIHSLTPADLLPVHELQTMYARLYPGAPVVPGDLYLSPAFHGGEDVFCAFEGERLLAYAVVYAQIIENGPQNLPHSLWIEVKAHPDLADPQPVKDALLDCLLSRSRELVMPFPDRTARLVFEYRANEVAAVDYALANGFQYSESVFYMSRDLTEPVAAGTLPDGVRLRRWKMESEAEQQAYVAARNECFPEAPISLGEWQYFMQSPQWAVGTTIAAFDGSELVGNVAVFWDEAEISQSGARAGYTDYIFVRTAWRGKGIAHAMVSEGMRYLQEHEMREARLAVRALNANALGLYQVLGFTVGQESRFYSRTL